ncbi:MAG: LeuA family protein [Acidobacteriota bacterium]
MEDRQMQGLIYDWNERGQELPARVRPIELDDETLRDGLQNPSVTDPTLDEKKRILHLMDDLGIHTADLGLPGAGPRAREAVTALATEIRDAKLKIAANCAARTVIADIQPVIDISQKVGIPIEVCAFIGSSPIRQYAEDWGVDKMLHHTEEAVTYAVKAGMPVMYVTEDTTRATPETMKALFQTAIRCGARRVCVCDTVGHIEPRGVRALIAYVKQVVAETGADVRIDWHGHRDRGLDLVNTLTAVEAGVDRVHGAACGIGERAGNTPMDLILVNLRLMGYLDNDLSKLPEYCRTVAEATRVPLPPNYPAVGADAFRTGTGVHAAAVVKAQKKGDHWLADRVYSGVPAGMLGLRQVIEVGPMSGISNVHAWLELRDIPAEKDVVDRIFALAKTSTRVLTDDEILACVRGSG